MNKNNYCVIMAGGIGSRFWPKSRTALPKQFIDILGTGKTLIQQTFDRLSKLCPKENIYIVSHKDYETLLLQQLDITKDRILSEPGRRNTAPCVAYAAYKIQSINPKANMIVAPADHLILKEDEFVEIMKEALDYTAKNNALLTLGIHPSRPDTGYGYIQYDAEHSTADDTIKKVKTFTEKPDLELAKEFISTGEFTWNSGIFVWSASSIVDAFETHLPEMASAFEEGKKLYNTKKEAEFITSIYSNCKKISIDYGIMEPADNVFVIMADIGWSDLGTWGSLYTHIPQDINKNAAVGKNVYLYNSKKNIVHCKNDKLIIINGLEDFIVVDTDDALLICPKQEEQEIKNFVNDIKLAKGDKFF